MNTRTLADLPPDVAAAIHMYANGFRDGVKGRKGITSGVVTDLFLTSPSPLGDLLQVAMVADTVAKHLHNGWRGDRTDPTEE